jgi:hypothetical protein
MREEMHKVLNEFGIKEKSGQSNRKVLFDAIEKQGGKRLSPVTVTTWSVSHAPIDSLMSWVKVDGIAGQKLDPDLKAIVLERLVQKAEKKFFNLNRAFENEETYVLNAITLPY